MISLLPLAKGGKLRPLAVTTVTPVMASAAFVSAEVSAASTQKNTLKMYQDL